MRSTAGQQARSFFPACFVCTMGNSPIKILYFQYGKANAKGWYRVNYIVLRNKKMLCYSTYCRDFEAADCFSSSCYQERMDIIIDTIKYIFLVHKVRCSRLTFTASHQYAANKYKARTRQICKGSRFCKSDIIWNHCSREKIPISKVTFSF